MSNRMAKQFDPAPHDKYAESPEEAVRLNRGADEALRTGLVGTFPASDPVSHTQPAPTSHDSDRSVTAWDRFKSLFR